MAHADQPQRDTTMRLKDLTIAEKRDLIHTRAHRSGATLMKAMPNEVNVPTDRDVRDAIIEFRNDLNRIIDLIEECGFSEDL